jgi:hypothetical protein
MIEDDDRQPDSMPDQNESPFEIPALEEIGKSKAPLGSETRDE